MVTIEDVAKKANVSLMTVSRVVNKNGSVRESTRKKVLKAINDLGYKPNISAKELVGGKSKTIGILSSNYYNQAYVDIVVAIEEYAYEKGFVVLNSNVNDYESAYNALELFLGKHVQGIIVLPLEMKMSEVDDYHLSMNEISRFSRYFQETVGKYHVPAITISQKIQGIENVAFDFVGLAKTAMDYLIGAGYKDISMINSNLNDGFWKEKEEIYVSKMKEAGLEDYIRVERDTAIAEGGNQAMRKLLEKHTPRVVFCANDFMAIGALQVLYENNLKVPDDVAVMGNDNVFLCELTSPKLTTVALNAKEGGQRAIERLFEKMNGDESVQIDQTVRIDLVKRESV